MIYCVFIGKDHLDCLKIRFFRSQNADMSKPPIGYHNTVKLLKLAINVRKRTIGVEPSGGQR
jgi:hypothetical protein